MAIKFITGPEIEQNLSKGANIINFYAEWCGPCKMFASVLEEVSLDPSINVLKINIDDAPSKEVARAYGVTGIPSTFFFKGNTKVAQETGYMPKEAVDAQLEEMK